MSSRSHRKINFNVSDQYEILDIIGEGAYGVVAYFPFSRLKLTRLDRLYTNQVDRKSPSRRLPPLTIQCSVFVL